jgi:hypothetical protein
MDFDTGYRQTGDNGQQAPEMTVLRHAENHDPGFGFFHRGPDCRIKNSKKLAFLPDQTPERRAL